MADKIIIIVGYGRSGSTLLDMMLAMHSDIFGAGEMSTICRHVWPNDEYCACHARVWSCHFWSGVMAEWLGTGIDAAAHAALQGKVEPILSARRIMGGAALRRYHDETLALFRITARHAGSPVILDSSKSPGRALALADAAVDLRVIHLVRDPRAVAWSMSKPMQIDSAKGIQKQIRARSPTRTALRWNFVNAGADALMQQIPDGHAIRIRYEDLIARPAQTLSRIGRITGLSLDETGARIEAGEHISASHQVAGSRIRMSGAMGLKADMQWISQMPEVAQRAVSRLCRGRMRRYGYAPAPVSALSSSGV
ncbi:MAG: sulfotransferase family protein [Paracoccus sp. (in: a-proteobacteria)]